MKGHIIFINLNFFKLKKNLTKKSIKILGVGVGLPRAPMARRHCVERDNKIEQHGTWSWPSGWCIGLRSWLRGFDAQLGHLYDAYTSLPQKYQAAIKWLEIKKKKKKKKKLSSMPPKKLQEL